MRMQAGRCRGALAASRDQPPEPAQLPLGKDASRGARDQAWHGDQGGLPVLYPERALARHLRVRQLEASAFRTTSKASVSYTSVYLVYE